MKYAFHWLVVVILLAQNLPAFSLAPVYRGSAGELSASNPVSDAAGWLQETQPPAEQTPLPTATIGDETPVPSETVAVEPPLPTPIPTETPTPEGTEPPQETTQPVEETPTLEPELTPTSTLTPEEFIETPADGEPESDEPPSFATQCGHRKDSPEFRVSANPAIYLPGKKLWVNWKVCSQALPEGEPASVLIHVPVGVLPAKTELLDSMSPDGWLTVPADDPHSKLSWRVGPEAEFPLLFELKLLINNEVIDEEALLIDQGHYEVERGGGHIEALNGKVALDLPENAIAEPLAFDVRYPAPQSLPASSQSWNPVEIIAVGKQNGRNVNRFNEPITLQMRYDEAEIATGSEEDLMIFYYDEERLEWYPIETIVDTENDLLIAQTDHLTVFDYSAQNWQKYILPSVDAFQVANFTGAGTYEMNFWVPPGPAGLQPDLKLTYNSQTVDQGSAYSQASWVGMGWTLETGSIVRNMHASNETTDDTFLLSIAGMTELLLPTSGNEYKTANDSFLKITRNTTADTWTVWAKDGTVYQFTHQTKTHTTNGCIAVGSLDVTWQWSLTSVTDIHGNTLSYSYYEESKPGCGNEIAVYPDTILYPNNRYRVRFIQESRGDYQSAWTTSSSKTLYGTKRLKEILVEHAQSGSWTSPTVVRKYAFTYAPNDAATNVILPRFRWNPSGTNALTLTLRSVQEIGGSLSLPATQFTYGDSQHLTRVDNGQGGQVELTYERWSYFDDVNDPLRSYFAIFGDHECNPYTGVGTSWTAVQYRVRCDPSSFWLQVGETGTVGIGHRSVPEQASKPGAVFEIAVNARAIPAGSTFTDVNFGIYDPTLSSNNQYMIYSDQVLGHNIGLTFEWLNGRVTMPANFSPNSTVMRIEGDNALVERIQFSVHPPYYRVTSRVVRDQVTGTESTYSYDYDNAAPNAPVVSEAVAGGGSLYTPSYREYRGNAMTQVVDPYGLATVDWYYQSDYLKGKPYRSLSMRRDFYDGLESLNSSWWTLSGGTQSISNIYGTDFDNSRKSVSTLSNWSVSAARNSYSLENGEVAIAHFRLEGGNAQGELGLLSTTNRFFGIVVKPEGGSPVARLRYDLGSGMVDGTVLIGAGSMQLNKWYTVMLFVDNNDGFQVKLWQADQPTVAGETTLSGLPAATWKFRQRVNTGTLWLDAYTEGSIYTETVYRYATTVSHNNVMGYTDLDVVWARQTEVENRNYDGDSSWEGTKISFGYETADQNGGQFGNLTRSTFALWNGSAWVNQHARQTRFWPRNDGTKYLASLPAQEVVLDCNPGCDFSTNGGLLAEILFIYDSNSVYNALPSVGQLTKQRTLVKEEAGQKYYDQVTYGYEYGSVSSITTYTAYTTAGASPTGGRTTTRDIDDVYRTYVLSETNPLGYLTSFVYDYGLGMATKVTGPNGEVEGAAYDSLGRMTAVCAPLDWDGVSACAPGLSAATLSVAYTNYSGANAPFRVNLDQKQDATHTLSTVRYYNGLGSLLQAQTLGAELSVGVRNVVVDYLYDQVGRQVKATKPYTYAGGFTFQAQNFSRPSTTTVYDDLGRVLQTQRPDGYPDTTYVYDGLETLITDANNHTTRQVRDPWGRLVEVRPQVGPWTGYSYDDLNRLTQARQYVYNTSTLIGTTTIAYDYAGRKTGMSDPDMGAWAYSYFANGTLHTQTDANGCLTTLTYNALDQMTAKQFSGSCGATPDVAITYFDPSVDYSKSRRTLMTDDSGSTRWTYDARGRVLSETKTITGGGSFRTQWTYTSADQVETMTYPGGTSSEPGEVVTYSYLAQGALDAVSGASTYVQDSAYDEAARLRQRTLGTSAIQTTFDYYPWTTVDGVGRLQSIQSVAGATNLQNLAYAYDGVGNVRTITDALAGPQTQTFLYDEVDRLSSAEAAGGSSGTYSLESYSYDSYGRLNGLPGTGTFGYGATAQEPTPPLHAVTAAGGVDYVYDAVGNLSQKVQGGSPITGFGYDGENRLTAVSGEDTASFVYDGDGHRVKGTVNGQTTYYVGNYLEVSDGQASPQPGSDVLIPYGSIWKFLDIGQQPDAGWTGLNYDDSDWDSGNAILGYGDGHEATLVHYGPSATNKYITTYFRKSFYANDDALYDAIEVSLDYDDGGVVYLNGVELFRANLPAGTISYSTLAATSIEDTTVTHVIDITDQLRTGVNVLAVEIHQQSPSSSDLHFDLELVGHRPVAFPADTLIDAGATWKYYASGAAPASGWTGASFDDSSWASGAAILGYGDGHEATVVPYGGDPNNKYITTYFRKSFTVADPTQYGTLDVILDFEDGAVVYLNGVELRRENLPAGTIGYSTLAPYALNDTTSIFRVNATDLQAGANVLAVEVHQQSRYSSDLHFELRLLGNRGGATLVEETLIAADGSWKYLDDGSDQGSAWRETSFNDASWAAGAAILGYGDGHETTVVSYGPDPNNKHITTYFRTSFQIDDPSQYLALDLAATFDDGIAIYLNGVELVRGNLPAGAISYTTLAPYGVDDVTGTASFDPAGLLVAGTNVLAVEVHQVSGSSSDLHFELELQAVREEAGQAEPGAAVWRQYYYAAGQRVAVRDGQGSGTAGLCFLLGDHLGSTNVTTDAAGNKLAELRYKPWGDVRHAEGTTPTSFRFTGQREEAELGIYYYGARWFDPALGHFLQADSLVPGTAIPLAWNRYAYTLYNPVKYTDPTGHYQFEETPSDPYFAPAHPGINPARRYVSTGVTRAEAEQIFLQKVKAPLVEPNTEPHGFGDYRGVRTIEDQWKDKRQWHASMDAGSVAGLQTHPVAAGTAVFTGWTGLGNTVIIEHDIYGVTLYSVYGHFGQNKEDTGIQTQKGQMVDYGSVIGLTGKSKPSGNIDPHLHFEVRFASNVNLSNTSDPLQGMRYWAYEGENWREYFVDLGKIWGYDLDNFGGH